MVALRTVAAGVTAIVWLGVGGGAIALSRTIPDGEAAGGPVRAPDRATNETALANQHDATVDGVRGDVAAILNEYNAVGSTRWLGGVDSTAEDVFFGRVLGNGGNWFEIIVTQDQVDMRGWQFHWQEDRDGGGFDTGTLTLTDRICDGGESDGEACEDAPDCPGGTCVDFLFWSEMRAGTIITFTESDTAAGGLDTDTSFNPSPSVVDADWWININTLSGGVPQTRYVTTATTVPGDGPGNFSVGNDNWKLTIEDATGTPVFGPVGEGICDFSGVSSREVGKLEEDPGSWITPCSNYNDGTSSTFGHPNRWSAGTLEQDFGPVRGTVIESVLVALSSPSPGDEVTTLPVTETDFPLGSTFYVEIWTQTTADEGLSAAFLDVTYDPDLLTAASIIHTGAFPLFTGGTIDQPGGRVIGVGGNHSLPCETGYGMPPTWVRAAILQMQADGNGAVTLAGENSTSLDAMGLCGLLGDVDVSRIAYGEVSIHSGERGDLILDVPGKPVTREVGEPVEVTLHAANLSSSIDAVQALINYNPNNLSLDRIDPVDLELTPPAAGWIEASELYGVCVGGASAGQPCGGDGDCPDGVCEESGHIAYVVTIEEGSIGPGPGPFPVATLTFRGVEASTPIVSFLQDQPPDYPTLRTELTDAVTVLPIRPFKTDTVDGDIIVEDTRCLISGIFYADGQANPANECEVCDFVVDPIGWTPAVMGTPCGDPTDDDCTDPDTCDGAGTCLPNHAMDGTDCDDGQFCIVGEACVDGECAIGDPRDCSDEDVCTVDSCDEELDTCVHLESTIIDLSVEVDALGHNVTRDVTVVLTNCAGGSETRVVPVDFDATGAGSAQLVDVDPGTEWVQATEGHTVSRLLPVEFALPDLCYASVAMTGADQLLSGDLANPAAVEQDNKVDIVDFSVLSVYWEQSVSPDAGTLADVNGDGVQNAADFDAMQVNFAVTGDDESGCPEARSDDEGPRHPLRGGPMLELSTASAACGVEPGDPVTVELRAVGLAEPINGVQALIMYDDQALSLVGVEPGDGTGSAWDNAAEVFEGVDGGQITYALVLQGVGTQVDAVAARMNFIYQPAGEPFTTDVSLLAQAAPLDTLVTAAATGAPIVPSLGAVATVSAKGDVDLDGDVDLVDYAAFDTCLGGPGAAYAAEECCRIDFDDDGDVDLPDFAAFSQRLAG
jgi:hypothetical protein